MLHFLRLRQTAVNYVISLPVSTCNFVLRNPFWFQNGRNDSRTRKVLVNACKKQLRAGKIPSGQLCQINTRRFARSQNRYSNTSAGKVSAGKTPSEHFCQIRADLHIQTPYEHLRQTFHHSPDLCKVTLLGTTGLSLSHPSTENATLLRKSMVLSRI